ncbi:MAG: D-glycero-beta-D-manno-heptose 1-phosphate adenylyltransferase [Pseudodesulfovibrio sp.]
MGLPNNPKLMSVRTFLKRKAEFAPGHKLVFTNGCFDVLHPGHVDLLARARALGDSLMLGLNSDESVRMLGKGDDRPVNSQEERAFVLAGLACVDYIVIFHESTPLELIRAVRPQVLAKGGDWTPDRIVGREVVEQAGGRVVSLPLLEGYSTTRFLERVRG